MKINKERILKELNIKKAIYIGLILTVIFTWPAAWHFFSDIPGRGSDTYQAIARTSMVAQHIEKEGWVNTFRWQKDSDFWGILPFVGYTQSLFGQMAGYNLWWFLSFLLAFIGMWIFVKDVTKSNWAAGVAGFIFAFSPFHFSHAVSTNIGTMHYEWLPWLGFFLYRFMRDTAWKNALGVAVSLLLIIATEHQLLAFTLLFLVFYFPFLLFLYPKSLKKARFWMAAAVGVAVLIAAGVIQFGKIWEIAHSQNNFLKPPYSQVEDYSADLIDFFIPARYQTFWGEKFNGLRENTVSNPEGRQSFYLGYLAIFLVLVGIVKSFRKAETKSKNERKQERHWIVFWGSMTLLFIILSLGPSLHFKGTAYLEKKLPYYWVYAVIPYWNYIRTTSRVFVIAVFGWAFLAGIGAKYLGEYSSVLTNSCRNWFKPLAKKFLILIRWRRTDRKSRFDSSKFQENIIPRNELRGAPAEKSSAKPSIFLVPMILVLLGLPLEYLSIPVPSLDLSYSDFYNQVARDGENYSILEVPGSTSYDFGSYSMYTAIIHGKSKIDGIDFARTEKDRWGFQRSTPIIENLLYSLPTGGNDHEEASGGDIVISDYTPFGASILNFYNIRFVILSKVQTGKKFGDGEFQNTVSYIEQKLGLASYYEDDFLKAYRVPQDKKEGYFLALDTNSQDSWGEKGGSGDSRSRWAKDGAKMRLTNMEERPINLEISFRGGIKYFHYLEVLLDGNVQKSLFLKEFKGDYSFALNQVLPGEHILEFKISDEKHQPSTDYSQDRGIKFSKFQTIAK